MNDFVAITEHMKDTAILMDDTKSQVFRAIQSKDTENDKSGVIRTDLLGDSLIRLTADTPQEAVDIVNRKGGGLEFYGCFMRRSDEKIFIIFRNFGTTDDLQKILQTTRSQET